MATPQQIPIKFVKSLVAPGSSKFTATQASRFFHKLLYEFWGFCVNGGTSLITAGGFTSVVYPSGFQSGTLLAKGTDGTTSFGSNIFSSQAVDFTTVNSGSLINKYLVTWVPGSISTDDSVYLIIGVDDSSHIRVDVHSGGTRRLGNHPVFWDRNRINWRIVDIIGTSVLSGSGVSGSWGGSNMVLSMSGSSIVNPGQASSQLQVMHLTESAGANVGREGCVGIVISPSGSWNGSAFTDGSPVITGSLSFYEGFAGGVVSNGQVLYDLTAGVDFLIAHVKSEPNGTQGSLTAGTGFHVEIPKRLYAQPIDPNPIAWTLWSNNTPSQIANTYYNGFNMFGCDNLVHKWTTLVRSLGGTEVRSDYTNVAYGGGQWQQFAIPAWRFAGVSYDVEDDSYLTSDGTLSLSTPGQFSLSRARLRRVRFTTADLSKGSKFGDPVTGTKGWVHLINGILWPWDNTILPERPWRFGV